MIARFVMVIGAAASIVAPLAAQQVLGQDEVVVTASRREAGGYDERVPAVGLRRRADFALQEVTIRGDTRDAGQRHEEMFAMLRGAIQLAANRGVELATGEATVEPLTSANYRSLTIKKDDRPDADKMVFFVKTALSDTVDVKGAISKIDAFVKAVPTVGRALIEQSDDLTLSVIRPDQYRSQIVSLVAEDAKAMAARFGAGYAVEAKGIERPVEWSRASLGEVFLYIPYQLSVVPTRP